MGQGKQKQVPRPIGANRFWKSFLSILVSKTDFEICVFLKRCSGRYFWKFWRVWEVILGSFWFPFSEIIGLGGKGGTFDFERQYSVLATFWRFGAPRKVVKFDKRGVRKIDGKTNAKIKDLGQDFCDFRLPFGVHFGSRGHPNMQFF